MLQATSGPTNLLLPLFWFLAAVGLVVWRLWSRRGHWRGGLVETALLVAALLVFVAAEMAGYRRPARIIAWDWLTLFLVVCLVRQLASAPGDQQAVFAVLLAGAVSLSIQAVYQAAALHAAASATFAWPGPFAGWLVLFLPGMFAAAFVCRPGRAPVWQTASTVVFALLGAAAFIAALVSSYSGPDATTPPLADLWRATSAMIDVHPLGVGPGNFSRAFPRFQPPGGTYLVSDPRNFLLEIAATCGVPALLAVLIALGAFFVAASRWMSRKLPGAMDTAAEDSPVERIRWEFYLGGWCGLILGFVIRQTTGDHTPDDILAEGVIAGARILLWLPAFALFERIRWSGRVRVGALAAGVAASLLVLVTNSGIGLPSVSVPLWAVVALALNGMTQRDYPYINRLALTRILPAALTAMVALLYFLDVFLPVTSCADNVQRAVLAGEAYRKSVEGKDARLFAEALNQQVLAPLREAAKDDADDAGVKVLLAQWTGELWTLRAGGELGAKLATGAVRYARDAELLDPQGPDGYAVDYHLRMQFGRVLDAVNQVQGSDEDLALAASVGPGYRPFLNETRWPYPLGRGALERLKQKYREAVAARKEDEINPHEPAIQYMEAADVLERYLPSDPNDAVLHYKRAEALFKAWVDDRCRIEAADALRLDAAAAHPPLTDDQRQKLNVWKDLPLVP